ncbi:patatin [Rhizocola hellebori]|uniref:Patatin n=1 Tax=Rhizocola hellebori TaxID=1392758 RepID=A0A8J3Q7L3_9ACTN|nr:patatin-like phospholipase family protein [Rhizocola hellebori]GIH04748.1 patatin [Rhizocola hellebori]
MGRRGLVLGAGGITGIAWQLGMMQGLLAHGVDVGNADLVVGTSAGSVAGAIVAGKVDLAVAAALPVYPGPDEGAVEPDWELGAQAFQLLNDNELDLGEARRAVGELALRANVIDEARFVAGIAKRLPVHDWPVLPHLLITAVDARSGELITWDASAQVPLDLAVAASCAVPCVFPPVTIGGRQYMDGGVRSGTNADLAAGCDIVLAFAPLAPTRLRGAPQAEFDALRDSGSHVELIAPDETALADLGPYVLDPDRWEPAVATGRRQAALIAEQTARLWSGGD